MLFLINLAPGGLLILAWYLAFIHPARRWVFIGLGVPSAFVILLLGAFMNLAAGAFLAATTPIEDVSRYAEIRGQMGGSVLVRHFPMTIPENATDARFSYLPKFMQGGGHLQLRLRLPQSEIRDVLIEYDPQAKYEYVGGDMGEHENQTNGVPTTHFYTSGTNEGSFPASYEILVFDAEPGGTPDFPWNHGYSYGVAISSENSEIVYWAEWW